ncbi:MAG: hypothetical protein AAGG08_15100, partial [Actinomycetota bacterium]
MPVRIASLVVTGADGTGRSTVLEEWVRRVDRATRVAPFVIRSRVRIPTVDDVRAWDLDADPDAAIAIDDAELLPSSALDVIVELAERRAVGLAAGTSPPVDRLDGLVEHLLAGTGVADPAEVRRTDRIDGSRIEDWFDLDGVGAPPDVLVRATAGNAA